MKKILSLVAVAATLSMVSCEEMKSIGGDFMDTMFEPSLTIENATVTSATSIQTRTGLGDMGIGGGKSKKVAKFDSMSGAGERYQTITVQGGGYNVKGDVTYNGQTYYTGMRGTLRVGLKTGSFVSFTPTY